MEGRKEAERERSGGGGWIRGGGGLSMHAEPQIHSSRLGLRTTHTRTHNHTYTHTALSGDPSGHVAVLYQVGLATSQTASITSHALHCLNCTMACLNGYTVFMNAAITVLAYMLAL